MTEIIKTYELVGKYQKLFDAKRGKYMRARSAAIFELDQTIPTFTGWEYLSSLSKLKLTFSAAPSYAVEDDIFDCFEKHFDGAE